MSNIVIVPTGGLANRLRVVFSYLYNALKEKKNLTVIWKINYMCEGYFLNYFEPINNVTFLPKLPDKMRVNYCGCSSTKWDYNYAKLVLKTTIKNKINNYISKYLGNDYVSVHIRRTDHVSLAKHKGKYTDDQSFIKYIDKYPTSKIYLATDNYNTQVFFKNRYKNRLYMYQPIVPNNHLRQTSLEHSIIDVYICAKSKQFMGSGFSSYSSLINMVRKTSKC